MNNEFIWNEVYRPQTVGECILPEQTKAIFQAFVDQRNVPNLLLCGGPGVGKTSVAVAMMKELGCDYIVVNGSMNGNIDTLRNEILDFASSVSLFNEGRKYVILDEADYLNANSTQPALRNFMEEYSKHCGFILTCNQRSRIIDALQSRCSVVEFNVTKANKPVMMFEFFKRVEMILTTEKVTYDKRVLSEFVNLHFPDMRRIVNELQYYSHTGNIDTGIMLASNEGNFNELVTILKARNFSGMLKWVNDNSEIKFNVVARKIYDKMETLLTPQSQWVVVVLIGTYQYQAAFAADADINLSAFLTEFMREAEWK